MKNSGVIYREMIEINIDEKCFWTKEQYTKGLACVCVLVCGHIIHTYTYIPTSLYIYTHTIIYLQIKNKTTKTKKDT